MKIHKEGHSILLTAAVAMCLLLALSYVLFPAVVPVVLGVLFVGLLGFIAYFFRYPKREMKSNPTWIFSPADGKIVAIEEVYEPEFLGEKRLLVSIFMSITNVHINWFPVSGRVIYFKHHNGSFRVAWHPKSSEENERTTTVIDMGVERILFRQIAGYVARRIVSYAQKREWVEQNSQCGFIKFGSRIDLYLPLDVELAVKMGDKVTGSQTCIAKLSPLGSP